MPDLAAKMSGGKSGFGMPRLAKSGGGSRSPMPMSMPPPPPPQEEEEVGEEEMLGQIREHLQASIDMIDQYLGGGEEEMAPEMPME